MKKLNLILSIVFTLCFSSLTALAQESVWKAYSDKSFDAYEKGDLLSAEKFLNAALIEAERAVENREEKANEMLCRTYSNLSIVLREQKKYAEAEDSARRAVRLVDIVYKESDESYTNALNNLGLALTNQKKYSEAEEIHRRAMKIREKYEPAPKYNLMVSVSNLALVYFEQAKYLEAKALFNQVVDFHLDLVQKGEWEASQENKNYLLIAMYDAVLSEEKLGDLDEAKKHIEALIYFVETLEDKNSPSLIGYLEVYARILKQKKQTVRVTQVENRIKTIKKLSKIQ